MSCLIPPFQGFIVDRTWADFGNSPIPRLTFHVRLGVRDPLEGL